MKYCDKAQSLGGPISLKRIKLGSPQIVQTPKMAYFGTDQNNNILESEDTTSESLNFLILFSYL